MEKSFKDNIHILCVEDDKFNRMVLEAMLQKLGYKKISMAEDSIKALAVLEQPDINISVILMDLGLPKPGVGGLELAKIIRQSDLKAKNVPIIALTGNDAEVAKEQSLAAGMNYFLTKPVEVEELGKILNITLEKK